MTAPTISASLAYAALHLLPVKQEIKKYLWAADLIYQAVAFEDIKDYLGIPAAQLALNSEMGAVAVNLLARGILAALAGLALLPSSALPFPIPKPKPHNLDNDLLKGVIVPPLSNLSNSNYEELAREVWGENATSLDPRDPRDKALLLTASSDWNGIHSPTYLQSFRNLGLFQSIGDHLEAHYDLKFKTFDHPLQICKEVRQAGKVGKVAAIAIAAHGNTGFIEHWDPADFASKLLPFCFKDNSPDSKILVLACNGATKPSDGSLSFAEYLFYGTGKTVLAADGLISTCVVNGGGKDAEFQMLGMGGLADHSATLDKEGFYIPAEGWWRAFRLMIDVSIAFRMARLGAYGLSFGSKICNYAEDHQLRRNQTSRFVSACLGQGSKLLQKSSQTAHKILDTIKNKTLNQLSFEIFPTCLRNFAKRAVRSAGQCLGCLKKPAAKIDSFEEQSGNKTAETKVLSYENSFRTAKFTFSTKEGTASLQGVQKNEEEWVDWNLTVKEKGQTESVISFGKVPFGLAKEKMVGLLACRIVAPIDTFFLNSLEKFHKQLKKYPGFPG